MTTTPAVRIKSSRPGFRRAGIAHAGRWTVYPAGTLSDEQLAELQAEPMLSVEVIGAGLPEPVPAVVGEITGEPGVGQQVGGFMPLNEDSEEVALATVKLEAQASPSPPAGDASPAGMEPDKPESESGKPEGADQLAAAAASTVAASAAPATAPKASRKTEGK